MRHPGTPVSTHAAYVGKMILSGVIVMVCALANEARSQSIEDERTVIPSDGWELIGDLKIPESTTSLPAVIMLNQAAGERTAYVELANQLARRGIASLRLDLRGHGASVNLGRFVPGEHGRDPIIWDAEVDVIAAHEYLKTNPRIAGDRIAMVGASYSGEEMAEAGRLNAFAKAYVALSPGSFGDESIAGIDSSGVPWLFVASNNERFLKEISEEVRQKSATVEMILLPGSAHASDLLEEHAGLPERIAVWLEARLNEPNTDPAGE